MSRYPRAEWVPWKWNSGEGPTYYEGTNRPSAVVLHRMQGYIRTARAWALAGHYGASWHYSIGFDGEVLQHLDHEDGGYQAGVADTQTRIHPPTWPLWKGPGVNVNNYTIGIEMEGFAAQEHPEAQLVALKTLCEWLSVDLGGIPYVRERYPAHAEIDVINRVNDFNTPAIREEVYRYLFQEEEGMTDNDILAIFGSTEADPAERLVNAKYRYDEALKTGNSPFSVAAQAQAEVRDHVANSAAGVGGPVPAHTHEPGKVAR